MMCNFVLFNLSKTVISIKLADFTNFSQPSNLIAATFQVLVSVLHFYLFLRFKSIYFIQIELDDYKKSDVF